MMSERTMLTTAASLGGIAFTIALLALPVIFNEIGALDDELTRTMTQYRMDTAGLWSDVQRVAEPVRHIIKRQTNFVLRPPVSTDGLRVLQCANGAAPLRNPDVERTLLICRDTIGANSGCPTSYTCTKDSNTRSTGICCPTSTEGEPQRQFNAFKRVKAPLERNLRQVGGGGQCSCQVEHSCPPGPKGAPGPPGDDGMDGDEGKDGRDGQATSNAEACGRSPCRPCPGGEPGADGPKGPAGAPGRAGPAGARGPSGQPGSAGPAGPKGDSSSSSTDGAPGPAGPNGANGVGGGTGAPGAKGPSGPAGPAGPAGPPGSDASAAGPPGDSGPAGRAGDRGARGTEGTAGTAGGPGESGNDAQYCPCPPRNVDASVLSQQYGRRRAFAFNGV